MVQETSKEWLIRIDSKPGNLGVTIVPVLSQPDDSWVGETGYVQAAFARAKKVYAPESTSAVLCGQKQMAEEVTSILVGNGVAEERRS